MSQPDRSQPPPWLRPDTDDHGAGDAPRPLASVPLVGAPGPGVSPPGPANAHQQLVDAALPTPDEPAVDGQRDEQPEATHATPAPVTARWGPLDEQSEAHTERFPALPPNEAPAAHSANGHPLPGYPLHTADRSPAAQPPQMPYPTFQGQPPPGSYPAPETQSPSHPPYPGAPQAAPPMGPPQHQGAPHMGMPYAGMPQAPHHAPPPGLDPHQLVQHSAPAPSRGWRQALHAASGGLINLGESKSQQQLNEMVARVRQPIQGDFRLAVLSLKGGVGKTTTTIGLGSAFASLRGDRVIAVDANPDLGTLASRVPQQTASTVRSVLHDPNIHRYTDIRRHTSQASSRLEVLASERDPAISEAFSADEYRKVIGVLENFYNIIMTDCGTGLMHSAMQGVLSTADAIVLVTSPAVDGAQSASATLNWLNAHGYQRLVSQAVVVISASKPGEAPIDLDLLTEHFRGRTRAVQIIPYDDHLATGSYVELDQLHRRTRTAFLELAATVADSFSGPIPAYPAAPQPWLG